MGNPVHWIPEPLVCVCVCVCVSVSVCLVSEWIDGVAEWQRPCRSGVVRPVY